MSAGRRGRVTLVLAALTALLLVASVPGSLREAWERGGLYILSPEFLLVLAGILVDSVCQWLILGASYLGAALVVGPVLIALPYGAARALANRVTTAREGRRAR